MQNATALNLPFLIRNKEIEKAIEHIKIETDINGPKLLVVSGDSGTGKSFLVKEILFRLGRYSYKEPIILYLDVAQDSYVSSQIFTLILQLCMVPSEPSREFPVKVSEKQRLDVFQRTHLRQNIVGRGLLRAVSGALGNILGLGDAVEGALSETSLPERSVKEDLRAYLRWAAKRWPVILAVDNYQFLNFDMRANLEAILADIEENIRFIVVNRTLGGVSELIPPVRIYSSKSLSIQLDIFSREETDLLVSTALRGSGSYSAEISKDIYAKTNGLAKDIQYCIGKYLLQLKSGDGKEGIMGLLGTIDRLPLMYRQLLLIASLLDGGIKVKHAENAIQRIHSSTVHLPFSEAVDELVAIEYLKINTASKDRIRPGHERIVQAMREIADDDLREQVRDGLLEEFKIALSSGGLDESETYLLHCLVGLQTVRELVSNLHYIDRLVRRQYRQEQFLYLVMLTEEIEAVICLLDESAIIHILDSFQKTSSFHRGLQLIGKLQKEGSIPQQTLDVFRFKFLVQLYNYDEALTVASSMPDGDWKRLYTVNALQALSRDMEAKEIVSQISISGKISEADAALLRNTISLFEPAQALINLERSKQYFQQMGSEFRIASVENNQGLIHLWLEQWGDASKLFNSSLKKFRDIGSGESYQALINLGVLSALQHRYSQAICFFEEAFELVPTELLLDRVKILMNLSIVTYCNNQISKKEVITALNDQLAKIRGVQMPYLRAALEANLQFAQSFDMGSSAPGSRQDSLSETTKLQFYLRTCASNSTGNWTLMASIHWRY
ncbi:tetratricopeptide repeat protein [uncultured Desulfuromonas sp.]|uniref:tetratricopeptide repeat protein n=1 Tax=uncultured Desulfuromonas sp. TaxID=181013 RepID=UPI002AAADD95|nr:tetratricopeptide repeat protein [uncultured Desulfuromonas sp.]